MATSPPTPDSLNRAEPHVGPPRYQPFVLVAAALAGGIVADRFGPLTADLIGSRLAPPPLLWWLAASGLWATWLLLLWMRRVRLSAAVLCLSIAAAGAAWHHVRWNNFGRDEIGRFATLTSAPVCFDALALGEPQRVAAGPETPFRAIPQSDRSQLLVQVVAIRQGTQFSAVSGVAQLSVEGHLLGVRAGDRLRVYGQWRRIAGPANPGEFDFAADARAERRLVNVSTDTPDAVNVLDHANEFPIARHIGQVREGAVRLLERYVGSTHSPLAATILLGKRDSLTDEVTDRYRVTGTIHLLVVSGLHVGLVVAGLYGLKRSGLVPRTLVVVAIIGTVFFYCLLTGANPPVIRAAVMATLVCLAGWTGRYSIALNSLAAAAVVVLLINPGELFRVGTQLSFLAVATLIQFGWWWHRRYARRDPLRRLIDATRPWPVRWARRFWDWNLGLLVATCAVWIVALPLVTSRMHLVTPAAVVISPLLWPLVTGVLWAGVGVLVFSQLIPPMALVCGGVCERCLAGLDGVVAMGSRMPGGYFWTSGPAEWWVIGFYLAVLTFFCTSGRILATRWWLALSAAWVIAGVVPAIVAEQRLDGRLDCGFLAMGHGCCIVIEAPNGQTLLYDAGSLSSPDWATQIVAGYLWERGIGRIDALVLSHADLDHYSAVPGLCERFAIGAVYVSPVMFERFGPAADPTSAPQMLRQTLLDHGIPIREIYSGDRLRVGDMAVEVLHPPPTGMFDSDNADSITLAIEYAGRRILLPGDLEGPGLEALLAELPYDTDLLLAPHHGSRRSDPPGLAAWATPELVVISGDGGSDVQGVERTYRASGARVLRTDISGAALYTLDPHGQIGVSTWRELASPAAPVAQSDPILPPSSARDSPPPSRRTSR